MTFAFVALSSVWPENLITGSIDVGEWPPPPPACDPVAVAVELCREDCVDADVGSDGGGTGDAGAQSGLSIPEKKNKGIKMRYGVVIARCSLAG